MKIAIVNIATIVTGDWRDPFAAGDTLILDEGIIKRVGNASAQEVESCDLVVDANGTTACPGLIDSQVHIAFGDYTPKQQAVGFLESYTHGGTTTSISASEIRRRRAQGLGKLPAWRHARPRRRGHPRAGAG